MEDRPIIQHVEGQIPRPRGVFNNLSGAASIADPRAILGMQINGSHRISQVNGDNAVTANGARTTDCWRHQWSGSMALKAQRGASGATGYIRENLHTVTTAQASLGTSDYAWFYQPIEGRRCERLLWGRTDAQYLTICGLLYTRTPGTYTVGVLNPASGRTYLAAVVLASGVLTPLTIQVPPDATATAPGTAEGLRVFVTLAAGTGLQGPAGVWAGSTQTRGPIAVTGQANLCASTTDNILAETGWMVFPGRYAPEVTHRPLLARQDDDEERLCQRYLQDVIVSARGLGSLIQSVGLPQAMRTAAAPVKITAGSPASGSLTGTFLEFSPGSNRFLRYSANNSGSGDVFVYDELWRIDAGL